MESGSVLKGLFYGGFASCVAETSKRTAIPRLNIRAGHFLLLQAQHNKNIRAHRNRSLSLPLTVTMPIDVVKTRLQMDGSGGSVKQYTGTMDCASKMVKAEGPSALFKGLPPALVRQSTYGSLRYGLYGPIKSSMGARARAGGGEPRSAAWPRSPPPAPRRLPQASCQASPCRCTRRSLLAARRAPSPRPSPTRPTL